MPGDSAVLGLALRHPIRSALCRQDPLRICLDTSQTRSPAGTVSAEEIARQSVTVQLHGEDGAERCAAGVGL